MAEKINPLAGEAVLRFDEVTFKYSENKPILLESTFVLRKGSKFTLMGPNGAGKSTLFSLIMGEMKPEEGRIIVGQGMKIAIAKQFIPHTKWHLTVREFLQEPFDTKIYDIDKRALSVFKTVELSVDLDKEIKLLSGVKKVAS